MTPGLLVALILGLRVRTLLTWAAIPAFSLATVFMLGEATMLLRVPFGLPAFAVLLVVLGGILAVVRSRRSAVSRMPTRTQGDEPARAPEARLQERVDYALLALGVAVGSLTWFWGLRNVPLIPPGGDATRHGWFVARILSGHTIDPTKVVTTDARGLHAAVNYYPLALHASAALSTRLVGSDVGRVLIAYIVVFSAVLLPVGMFVLARTLAPTRLLVAGFTALVVPLLTLFPYFPVWTGDVPQMVAMALVPATVVLLLRVTLARDLRVQLSRACLVALAPSAFAIFCIVSLHASELPLIVLLSLLLVLEQAWRQDDAWILLPALIRGVAVGAFAIVLFTPTLISFTHGVSERADVRNFVVENPLNWEPALGAILQLHFGGGTARQGFLSLLALAGAALWLMRRRPAWVAGWVGIVLLSLFASASTNRLADKLTFPWYHLEWRILPNVAFFVPFFAGVTLAYGAVLITRVSRRSKAILPASLAMIAFLAQFVGVHSFRVDSAYIRRSFDPDRQLVSVGGQLVANQALVARTSLAAFQWLHDHAAPGDTVASEPSLDGSLWMYAQQRVAPLIGPYLHDTPPELADRFYLTRHLQSLGRDTRVDDLARHYHTRWVYFDTHRLLLGRGTMSLAALQQNPSLTEVFHEGGTWVFRIDLSEPSGA